jgi:hypothetical protein
MESRICIVMRHGTNEVLSMTHLEEFLLDVEVQPLRLTIECQPFSCFSVFLAGYRVAEDLHRNKSICYNN